MSKVAGQFHIRVVDATTGVTRKELEFDNLVVDIGLERYARGWQYNTYFACIVGTGTNVPDATDTTLGNRIAKTNLSFSSTTITGAPYYARQMKFGGRFDAGAIANTITEIGVIERDSNLMWCRQLILDEQGNPSTITVLPNEYLDVTYTLYTYPNLQDKVFTFNMDGVTYNCVSRLALAARDFSSGQVMNISPVQGQNVFSTQTLGGITEQPTGTNVGFGTLGNNLAWDAAYPYSRSCSLTLGLNVGNVSGGIGSMLIADRGGWFYHQISFDPVLPKDNTVQMTLIFSDTVSRYSAP